MSIPIYNINKASLLELRHLCRKRNDWINLRVATGNRIDAIKEIWVRHGIDTSEEEASFLEGKTSVLNKFPRLQRLVEKQMKNLVVQSRLWIEWLSKVNGIGIGLAGQLIGTFEPYWQELEVPVFKKGSEKPVYTKLFRPQSRSALNKMCGLLVVGPYGTGRAERRQKGKKCSGNPQLKALILRNVVVSLIRQKGSYYQLYLKLKQECEDTYSEYLMKWYKLPTRKEVRKTYPKEFIPSADQLARRRLAKIFLSHLYEKLNEIYGIKTEPPQHAPNQPLTEEEWIHPLTN